MILKKTKYVAVVASGPGIYEESWGPKPCPPFCTFSKVKLNEIRVYPDKKCGTASVVIYGYNGADQLVGKAFFNVTNDECKRRATATELVSASSASSIAAMRASIPVTP